MDYTLLAEGSFQKENVIRVGFLFLMVVTVFALYNDISRILPG